jgi:hypothetical protein
LLNMVFSSKHFSPTQSTCTPSPCWRGVQGNLLLGCHVVIELLSGCN